MQVHVELWQYPQKPFGQPEPKAVQRIRERFDKQFKDYRPRRLSKSAKNPDNRTHVVDVPAGDSQFERLLAKFTDEANKNYNVGGWITCEYGADEVIRAKYAVLGALGDDVDSDENWRPLNKAATILCSNCRQPDMAKMPDPFIVSKSVTKKRKQEIFKAGVGLLIVRPRVHDLLVEVISEQIEVGTAVVAGDRRKTIPAQEQLYWIRPRNTVGARTDRSVMKNCSACGRPTVARAIFSANMNEKQEWGQIHDLRNRVSHFADGTLDLAWAEGFIGEVVPGKLGGYFHEILISGALASYLKAEKVSGFVVDEPVLSATQEPAFEAVIRGLGKASPQKQAGQASGVVPGLKGTAWDTKDGFIHFYLTSPELVVSDPMVWSEKGTAEFRVPRFKPGLYRLPLSAIKRTRARNRVEVDSGSMVFVDAEYLTQLEEAFDWSESINSRGQYKKSYLTKIAKQVGNRFGFCIAPGLDSGCEFDGDGVYTIDIKAIERVGD